MGVAIAFVVVYYNYNPGNNALFPKCALYSTTGLKCPGCGSQRAIHNILQGNVAEAFMNNMLLVISIPYLLMGFYMQGLKSPSEFQLRWREKLFGKNAIYIILILVIGFWIIRNLLNYCFRMDI